MTLAFGGLGCAPPGGTARRPLVRRGEGDPLVAPGDGGVARARRLVAVRHTSAAADPARAVGPLVAMMLVYSIGCQISLTLTNVISFRNLPDSEDSFGYVRLVGTFGWVVGGVAVGWGLTPLSSQPLYFASVASLVMVAFSFTLPHTPPKGYGRPVAEVLGLPAFTMLRDRSVVIFAAVLFAGNLFNQFYILLAAALSPRPRRPTRPGFARELGTGSDHDAGAVVRDRLHGLHALAGAATGTETADAAGAHGLALAERPPLYGQRAVGGGDRHSHARLELRLLRHVGGAVRGPRSSRAFAGGDAIASDVPGQRSRRDGGVLHRGPRGRASQQRAGTTDWSAVWFVPLVGYVVALVVFALFFREPPGRNGNGSMVA